VDLRVTQNVGKLLSIPATGLLKELVGSRRFVWRSLSHSFIFGFSSVKMILSSGCCTDYSTARVVKTPKSKNNDGKGKEYLQLDCGFLFVTVRSWERWEANGSHLMMPLAAAFIRV
jgi:hypothetical protein